jgi:hypothetical protein
MATFFSGGGWTFTPNPPPPKPVSFSLGPAPELGELKLDYTEMGKRAVEANAPFAEQYKQLNPEYEAGNRAMSALGSQLISGQLPRDMAANVARSAAASGLSTGLGSRSGLGRNLVARDLGLSSLQVQEQGANLLAKSSALAQQAMQAMTPISPGQVFDTASSQASFNQQMRNQNLINAWQSQGLPGQFDIRRGGFIDFEGGISKTRPGIWTGGYQNVMKYPGQPGMEHITEKKKVYDYNWYGAPFGTGYSNNPGG